MGLARTFDEGLRLLRAHRGQWEAMSLGDTYLKDLGNTLGSGVDVKKGGA